MNLFEVAFWAFIMALSTGYAVYRAWKLRRLL